MSNVENIQKRKNTFSKENESIVVVSGNHSTFRNQDNLNVLNPNKFFLERLCSVCPNAIVDILFNCNLQAILAFRLVSKKCLEIVSHKGRDSLYTPLENKAAISPFRHFHYNSFAGPNVDEEEKVIFAKNNTEVPIILYYNELINPTSILTSIPEQKLSIVLEIETEGELSLFQELVSKQPRTKFLDKIKELRLGYQERGKRDLITRRREVQSGEYTLSINKMSFDCINEMLKLISQNSAVLPNFTSLCFEDISVSYYPVNLAIAHIKSLTKLSVEWVSTGVTFELPDALTHFTIRHISENQILKLPDLFSNLRMFEIGIIGIDAILELPDSLVNLEILKVGEIKAGATLKLPARLDGLRTLQIKRVDPNAIIQCPKSFEGVIDLIINNITHASLKVLNAIPNLTSLEIETIDKSVILVLPETLKKLKNVKIGRIDSNGSIEFPDSINQIETLIFQETYGAACRIELPYALPKLTTLKFYEISSNFEVLLPPKLDQLENLTITHIKCINDTLLKLLNSCNLTHLVIGSIYGDMEITFPDALRNLKSLTINGIGSNSTLDLTLLENLNHLCIKSIDKNVILKLPSTLEDLVSLRIERSENSMDISFPNELNSLRHLTLEEIYCTVNLPESLPNLENLEVINIGDRCRLPDFLPQLKILVIGALAKDDKYLLNLINSASNLEHLTISSVSSSIIMPCLMLKLAKLKFGSIRPGAYLELPKSLPNLTNLEFGSIGESIGKDVYLELPKSMPKLTTLLFLERVHKSVIKFPISFPSLTTFTWERKFDSRDLKLHLPFLFLEFKLLIFRNLPISICGIIFFLILLFKTSFNEV
ncbi:MAG: hypothetical protein C5B43_01720 [Verrucomicrobia bacterium]|nr:MAG: hypothetical protein C5B43_01720 [Verrucomicrobiota bacterium]